MGQEERKNKSKLEKTQIQMATTSNEYEAAVKALEETTGKWNRDWKAACDVRVSYPCLDGDFLLTLETEVSRPRRRAVRLYKEQLVDFCQYCFDSLCER